MRLRADPHRLSAHSQARCRGGSVATPMSRIPASRFVARPRVRFAEPITARDSSSRLARYSLAWNVRLAPGFRVRTSRPSRVFAAGGGSTTAVTRRRTGARRFCSASSSSRRR
jgi:hypothetical protein